MEEGLLTLFAAFFVEKARAYLRQRSEDIELAFEGVGVARLYVEGGGWRGRVPTLIAYFAEGARARLWRLRLVEWLSNKRSVCA